MVALSRIELLLQQQKYELAQKEITLYLAENPNEGLAHTYLALALLGTKKNEKALEAAKVGVGLSPMSSFALYVLSKSYINLDDLKNAEEAQVKGLRISPNEEHYLTNYAAILNDLGKKEEALSIIEQALKVNPLSSGAKQIKSIVLRKLGRYEEADVVAGESLKDNPESANAFAAKGWASLDVGKAKEALEYFRSAVVLDPTNSYAKSGMVMAMKAQNWLFNLFYKYYNWISRLPSRIRWGLAIGIVILFRGFNAIKTSNEQLAPVFGVLIGLYLCFVFLAWTINPVFNIFLLFNKYGKHALNKGEKYGAWVMLSLLGLVVIQLGLVLLFPIYPILGVIGFLFLALPAASTFANWNSKHFKRHLIYTMLLSVLLITSIILDLIGIVDGVGILWVAFLLGVVGYSWVSQIGK